MERVCRIPQDEFTREIDSAVMSVREHRERRTEYMQLPLREQDIKCEAWGR